jgi:tetratricopeptide (TPR) repeat protein
LARQALLLAGRHELGLATRDGALQETLPEGNAEAGLELVSQSQGPQRFDVELGRTGPAGGWEALWWQAIALTDRPQGDYPDLLAALERLSREEFPRRLEQAGCPKAAPPAASAAPVPAGAERRLNQLNAVAQFAALRELYAAVRAHGESPALLGALVRAHAHLGVLTEFHWVAAHKAHKARALLYAQRLAVREPKSPAGLWHRAYAWALAGRHQDALNDLAAAGKLAPAGAAAPAWADLLDAFCRFDLDRLTAAADQSQLGGLLLFLAVEDPATAARTIQVGQKVLADNPECQCVHDALAQTGGVGHKHTSTLAGPQVFRQTLAPRLGGLDDLPPPVKQALGAGGGADERRLIEALLTAGAPDQDTAEPSWSALGRLLQETRFTHVFHRLDFMRFLWSVPVDEFLAESLPLVAAHPYRPLIELYGAAPARTPELVRALLASPRLADAELTHYSSLASYLRRMQDRPDSAIWSAALAHRDDVHRDLVAFLRGSKPAPGQTAFARRLHGVSPFSPFGTTYLIRTDWDNVRGHAAEWEKAFAGHPQVLAALGQRHAEAKRWADAERCYQTSLRLSTDSRVYEQLAETFAERGDWDRWRETLEAVLREEDPGLDHARVRVQIARHYMRRGEWQKAQPYAEAAAETWAGWAMLCAADCAEGLGDWEQAELWVRRTSERYDQDRLEWFFWCRRTGRGDVGEARELAEQYVRSLAGRRPPVKVGFFYLAAGERDRALDFFQKDFAAENNHPLPGLLVALLADEGGQAELRDQVLRGVNRNASPTMAALADLFRRALEPGGRLDPKETDAALAAIPGAGSANSCYLVGQFLKTRGQTDEARRYLDRCLQLPQTQETFRVVAAVARRALDGKEPAESKNP